MYTNTSETFCNLKLGEAGREFSRDNFFNELGDKLY